MSDPPPIHLLRRTPIRPRSLPIDRQPRLMSRTPITPYLHHPINVIPRLPPQFRIYFHGV